MDTNGKKDRPTSKVYLCNCIYTRFKVRRRSTLTTDLCNAYPRVRRRSLVQGEIKNTIVGYKYEYIRLRVREKILQDCIAPDRSKIIEMDLKLFCLTQGGRRRLKGVYYILREVKYRDISPLIGNNPPHLLMTKRRVSSLIGTYRKYI